MQMDQHLNNTAVRPAVFRKIDGLGVLLLLWSLSVGAVSSPPDHDYMLPADAKGGYLVSPSNIQLSHPSAKQSSSVSYQAFDGSTHNLIEHTGRYVRVLLPNEAPFTPDHIEELIDQLDMQYVLYTELMHAEPYVAGPLTIAFLPDTCSYGCGLLGYKGIEILSDPLNYDNIIRELDAGRLEAILVHEMVHNFDRYSNYLHYLPDHPHAWTDFFEFFAPNRFARNSRNNEAPDDAFDSPVRNVWKDYVTNDAANWETCVRDQACAAVGLTANNLWAMVYYRIESLHGVEAVLNSFEFLADYAATHSSSFTADEKEGLRILSLGVGAGSNISCYMDSLKWPVTADVRAELQKRFGGAGPQCNDADGDGFNAVTGDCDDANPARNILAPEIPGNGFDDDCDGQVDEATLVEVKPDKPPNNYVNVVQATLPFEVDTRIVDSEEYDTFQFPLGETSRTRVTLCSEGDFKGWAVALQAEGIALDAPVWNSYQANLGCVSSTFEYQGIETGRVLVLPDEAQGDYSLAVNQAGDLLPDYSVYLQVEQPANGGVTLRVDDRDGLLAGLGADELEFWISGAGLQVFRPFKPQMSVFLGAASLPGLESGANYQVRVRPRRNGLPLAGFSAGHLFHYQAGMLNLPSIDSTYSGAWFNPGHDGEGFIIEVLENQRALVYWFTYDDKGNQRWMVGTGAAEDNQIVVGELMDASGGRFGPDYNPADVELKTVGSLSISFQGCEKAIANFSIDNIGGHQELYRLTELYGHECGKDASAMARDINGSWYDPAHDGEGFIVQQLNASEALVVWFTFDANGEAAWMLSNGTVVGNRISFPQLDQFKGGKFGRSFDPQAVSHSPWGELTLDLDCDGGSASYTPTAPGYTSGSQALIPLTRLKNSSCP
ncbi:putative metal-binding motif-containing protein [Pseudomonadota bacterium]